MQQFVHRITGLFGPPAVDDLRVALEGLPGVELISADLDYGEATFTYDPAKAFPGVKPDKIVERFNDALRTASKQMFGVREVSTTPREILQRVRIRLVAIDCKVCCLALQEMLLKQEGVEQATADMRAGEATALIDPARTSREKLEAMLKSREVALRAE